MSAITVPTMNESADADGGAVELDEMVSVLSYLREVIERQKHYTKLRENAEAMVKSAMGDAEIGTVAGESVVTYKSTKRISVSHKDLVEHFPEVAMVCQRTSTVRTFRLVD